jgi:hypothetical protein
LDQGTLPKSDTGLHAAKGGEHREVSGSGGIARKDRCGDGDRPLGAPLVILRCQSKPMMSITPTPSPGMPGTEHAPICSLRFGLR